MVSNIFKICLAINAVFSICCCDEATSNRNPRTVRATLQSVGLGPWCVGCPQHFCDDDPNIIEGYCCGCARLLDYLPINCPYFLRCPVNIYQLCLRYEYMMHCCC